MSEPKFTSGPWRFTTSCSWQIVSETSSEEIMDKERYEQWTSDNMADWHLIAAAPELYEALELLVSYGDVFAYRAGTENPYLKGKAALAKARGEA